MLVWGTHEYGQIEALRPRRAGSKRTQHVITEQLEALTQARPLPGDGDLGTSALEGRKLNMSMMTCFFTWKQVAKLRGCIDKEEPKNRR